MAFAINDHLSIYKILVIALFMVYQENQFFNDQPYQITLSFAFSKNITGLSSIVVMRQIANLGTVVRFRP
jgi:hypothetical protein